MARCAKVFVMCIIYIWTASNSVINSVRASDDNNTKKKPDPPECEWDCQITVSWIGHSMNSSVDPCDDFYQFTCGRFGTYPHEKDLYNKNIYETAHEDVKYRLKNIIDGLDESTTSKLGKLVKTLYNNCMHSNEGNHFEEYDAKFKTELSSGPYAWPVVASSWNSLDSPYTYILNSLFDVDFQYDLIDVRRKVPRIKIVAQGLDRAILRMGMHNKIVQAYHKYMVDMAVICGADRSKADFDLFKALNTAVRMADDGVSDMDTWVNDDVYTNTNLKNLQETYPNLEIKEFLSVHVPRYISDFEKIIVPKAFARIAKVISETPKMDLLNLITWHRVEAHATFINGQLHDRQLEFYRLLGMYKKTERKWMTCIDTVKLYFELIVAAFYQRKYINETIINEVTQMAKIMQTNVVNIVQEADWLDQRSIEEIRQRVNHLTVLLPYRDEYKYNPRLEKYYAGLQLDEGDIQDSIAAINDFASRNQHGRLENAPQLDDWSTFANFFAESASFDYKSNKLNLPVAYLSTEFYDVYREKYLNYATVGLEIAHEISHSLDNIGIRYDSRLDEHDWMPLESKKKFYERVQCLIDQAGNYTFDEIGMKLQPHRKLSEIIADNVGVEVAYRAYLQWSNANEAERSLPGLPYTNKQMFWIALGNSRCKTYERLELMDDVLAAAHPPAEFRVNGVLVNRPEFATDFGCKPGSRMNPVNKCSLW